MFRDGDSLPDGDSRFSDFTWTLVLRVLREVKHLRENVLFGILDQMSKAEVALDSQKAEVEKLGGNSVWRTPRRN